jgi:hypothetical protein
VRNGACYSEGRSILRLAALERELGATRASFLLVCKPVKMNGLALVALLVEAGLVRLKLWFFFLREKHPPVCFPYSSHSLVSKGQ